MEFYRLSPVRLCTSLGFIRSTISHTQVSQSCFMPCLTSKSQRNTCLKTLATTSLESRTRNSTSSRCSCGWSTPHTMPAAFSYFASFFPQILWCQTDRHLASGRLVIMSTWCVSYLLTCSSWRCRTFTQVGMSYSCLATSLSSSSLSTSGKTTCRLQ